LKVVERENWCKERLSYALRTAQYETRTLGGVRGAPWAYGSRPSTRLATVARLALPFLFTIISFFISLFPCEGGEEIFI
ncbi:MAG: hypothetical protein AAF149_16485, partial [Bacteroidota bacterium]